MSKSMLLVVLASMSVATLTLWRVHAMNAASVNHFAIFQDPSISFIGGCESAVGSAEEMLPAPWNARTRVHEYGGKSYLPLPDGFAFANFADQRLYRCRMTASAMPWSAGSSGASC